MNVIDKLRSGNVAELQAIYGERRKVNQEYGNAAIKARKAACHLNKATWNMHSLVYVNALLIGTNKAEISDSYITMVLLSTIEDFSFAQMGMTGLTYVEYNLCIGPVASILDPQLFQDEQTWKIQFIPETEFTSPYYPPSHRRAIHREVDLDPYGELQELGLDAKALRQVMKKVVMNSQTATPAGNQDSASALERMRLRMRSQQQPQQATDHPVAPAQSSDAMARLRESMKNRAHKQGQS